MNPKEILKSYEIYAGEKFGQIGFSAGSKEARNKRDYVLDIGRGFQIFFYPGGYRKHGGVMVEPVFGLDYQPLDDYFMENVDAEFDPRVGHIFAKGSYEENYDLYFLTRSDQIESVVNRVFDLYNNYVSKEISAIASENGVLSFLDEWAFGDPGNIVTGNEIYIRNYFREFKFEDG